MLLQVGWNCKNCLQIIMPFNIKRILMDMQNLKIKLLPLLPPTATGKPRSGAGIGLMASLQGLGGSFLSQIRWTRQLFWKK
ncbi:hypothetical protein BVRB_2g023510 [Beta vulgaris subsp. vulgaris]|nr:hypothetical protein BVRB_2g023510 [Beta vulgaris subsp. vulgaris]